MNAVEWLGDRLKILDQTRLPHDEIYLELKDYKEVAHAIKDMKVRGAPAIGIAAGYAIALGALNLETKKIVDFIPRLEKIIAEIAVTRPTARNLFMATERMEALMSIVTDVPRLKEAIVAEAQKIHHEEIQATEKISSLGAELINNGDTVLTHCNAGPIATAGYGTALGVIIKAHKQGKRINVLATETRPLCQGARLTALELKEADIPFKLITDSMAGYFISRGKVNLVITGADRIAANGDTANKIGTYTLAVLAKEHSVPFYIAAPTSTVDTTIETGADIPIEERSPEEITHHYGKRIAPKGVEALNPAFDITPHKYITAIITERGIIRESGNKCSKYKQTQEELLIHLKTEVSFLNLFSSYYDSGIEAFAKKLALEIRILICDDMRSSRSLLEQLDKKGILFYNSAVPYDKTATFQTPCLTSMEISTKGHTKYKAPLDSRTMNKICFIKWWDQDIIYKDKSGNIFTRKELVRNVTDCDGGTHIDPNLKEAYANLSRLNLTRLRVVTNKGKGFFVNSPVLPSIRQIAYELLKTLEDEFPDLF